MLYERLRTQWRRQSSMSAIRDFPPRCGPRASSNKPIEIRNPSNGLAEVKGKCQNKSRKSLEKKEVELLKVGALRNYKRHWRAAFLAWNEEEHVAMVKEEEAPPENSAEDS